MRSRRMRGTVRNVPVRTNLQSISDLSTCASELHSILRITRMRSEWLWWYLRELRYSIRML